MNILDYIDDLMSRGMSEEDASICADCYFNTDWEAEHELYYEDDCSEW